MLKIYDCSNSDERPPHRHNSFGPMENDIISDLKKYAQLFDAEFVKDYSGCDIILTNDVFPSRLKSVNIPKVKRMDGVYWRNCFKDRNEKLNIAAMEADCVIFISEFSKGSLLSLYGDAFEKIKDWRIILNTADNSIFYPKYYKEINKKNLRLTAIASSWTREEKRFDAIIQLAKITGLKINLIGDCPYDVPSNVSRLNYIASKEETAKILREDTDILVNLSYRDACPKVVSQAIASGIPVFYANSGGVIEQTKYGYCGIGFRDEGISDIYFQDFSLEIDIRVMSAVFDYLVTEYENCRDRCLESIPNHMLTIREYFKVLREFKNNY